MAGVGRPKGSPKTGGRVKGTPNKRAPGTLARELAARLKVDPLEIILLFAKGDYKALGYKDEKRITGYSQMGEPIYEYTIEPDLRQKSAKDAAPFLFPTLKAVEFTPPEGATQPTVIIYSSQWGNTAESTDDDDTDEDT